jgi:phage terminase small subunit
MPEQEKELSFEELLARLSTDKQREFCRHYINCLVATRAAKRAGYSENSENGAAVEGSRLLRKPKIRAAVDAGLRELGEDSRISRQWVLEKLKQTFDKAYRKRNLSAANRSLMLLAKALGMLDKDLNVNLRTSGEAKVVLYFPDNERGPKPKGDNDGSDTGSDRTESSGSGETGRAEHLPDERAGES